MFLIVSRIIYSKWVATLKHNKMINDVFARLRQTMFRPYLRCMKYVRATERYSTNKAIEISRSMLHT